MERVLRNVRTRLPLIGVLLIVGCGSFHFNLNTEIRGPNDYLVSYEIRATGVMAEMIREGLDSETDEWQQSVREEGETLIVEASREFQGQDAMIQFGLNSGSDEGFAIAFEEIGGKRIYTVEWDLGDLETSPESSEEDALDESAQAMTDAMIQAMAGDFTIDWTVTIPGRITDHNANSVDGNTLSWHLNLVDIQKAGRLYVNSEETIKAGLFGGCS